MTTDDRTKTITDRAAIRDSDEPSERGDFPCCSGARAAGGAVAALDLITILDRAERAQQAIGTSSLAYPCVSVDVPALVAEVSRLRAKVAAVEALLFRRYVGSPQFEETPEHVREIDALADLYDDDLARDLRAALATGEGK